MAFNLRTYENQAKLSLYLGLLGALATLAVVALLVLKFDRTTFYVTYNAKGVFLPLLGIGVIVGLGAGTTGFFVGLSSAGQRRNTLSTLSWRGFFLNALVLTALMSAAIFFYFTRNPVIPKPLTAKVPPGATSALTAVWACPGAAAG